MHNLTIIICVHSQDDLHDKLFERALKSLKDQYFQDFKTIIVFDECHEKTKRIAYYQLDSYFHVNKPIRNGLGEAKNYGIQFIDTEWTGFLDADDWIYPDKFEKQIEFWHKNPEIDIISTHYQWADIKITELTDAENKRLYEINILKETCFDNSMYLTHEQITERLPKENVLCHGSVMIRTKILKELKYDNTKIGYEDWDLWLRCLEKGYKFAQLPERLYIYTRNPNPKR